MYKTYYLHLISWYYCF